MALEWLQGAQVHTIFAIYQLIFGIKKNIFWKTIAYTWCGTKYNSAVRCCTFLNVNVWCTEQETIQVHCIWSSFPTNLMHTKSWDMLAEEQLFSWVIPFLFKSTISPMSKCIILKHYSPAKYYKLLSYNHFSIGISTDSNIAAYICSTA